MENFESKLLSADFDEIQFLNELFPTEDSINTLPNILSIVENEIKHFDSEMKEAVRTYSTLSSKSQKIIQETSSTIQEIDDKVDSLQSRATNTQLTVSSMCQSIKAYDNAKTHLTESITCLKRLQMTTFAVSDLEEMYKQCNYSESADRILALTTLLEYFQDFESNQELDNVRQRFEVIKREIKSKITYDLDQKLFSTIVDSSVSPAFKVIESLGDRIMQDTIDWFCSKYLEPYVQQYQKTPLQNTKDRYLWLKNSLDEYKDKYSQVIPQNWRMPYNITLNFCIETRKHLREIIEKGKPTLENFTIGFESTAMFEQALSQEFGSNIINEKGNQEWKNDDKFVGLIGSAFTKHTQLYLAGINQKLKLQVQDLHQKSSKIIDSTDKTLKSSNELVEIMNNIIKRCAGFNDNNVLYDLFFHLKNTISEYTDLIFNDRPTNLTSDKSVPLYCATINTFQFFKSIINGLSNRIRSFVNEDQKSGVRVDDIDDKLGDNLARLVRKLSGMICNEKCQSGFSSLQSGNWMTCPDNQCVFGQNICKGLEQIIPVLKKWMRDESFNYFRSQFIVYFVNKIIEKSFMHPHVGMARERLAMATDDIEKKLIEQFGAAPESIQEKFIKETVQRIRHGIRVLLVRPEDMPTMYVEITNKPSASDFKTFLGAKGLSTAQINQLMQTYSDEVKKKQSGK